MSSLYNRGRFASDNKVKNLEKELKVIEEKKISLPSPSNCVEFINEDGKRYAWSESNVQYEEVPEDGGSFTVLRNRLERANRKIEDAEELIYTARQKFNMLTLCSCSNKGYSKEDIRKLAKESRDWLHQESQNKNLFISYVELVRRDEKNAGVDELV